MNSKYF